MKATVIGYGSIGKRHARLLGDLGCRVSVVSKYAADFGLKYDSLGDVLRLEKPDYIVIANTTVEHRRVLQNLADLGFNGRVLIEKPLFHDDLPMPDNQFAAIRVAYNLRFHPLLLQLKNLLDKSGPVVSAHIYCGSYLPDWRAGVDFRRSYSASIQAGGGVLRDLSHEIDYCQWLLGPWIQMTARGGHLSRLPIESDDAFTLMMEMRRCPLAVVEINYLDRMPRRTLRLITNDESIHLDLIRNEIEVNGRVDKVTLDRDATYLAEHRSMIEHAGFGSCTVEEALDVLFTIRAAEQAAKNYCWIKR